MITILSCDAEPAKEFTRSLIEVDEYFGFSNKFTLFKFIRWKIGDGSLPNMDTEDINDIVKNTLETIRVDDTEINIYVMPSSVDFLKEEMNGISGYSSTKNTIALFIADMNGEALQDTLTHEYAHAVMHRYHDYMKSVDSMLVFEGIAEHFKEDQMNPEASPWIKALDEEEALQIYGEIDDLITHEDLFFGTGDLPRWAGYSIGYYITKPFIDTTEKDWGEIFKTEPEDMILLPS